MWSPSVFLLYALAACVATALGETRLPPHKLRNVKVSRTVDIRDRIVRMASDITLKNEGDSTVYEWHVWLPKDLVRKRLGWIFVEVKAQGGSEKDRERLDVERIDSEEGGSHVSFKVLYPSGISKGSEVTYRLRLGLGHSLQPLPRKIGIKREQYVMFEDLPHLLSPYPTDEEETSYRLPRATVENASEELVRDKTYLRWRAKGPIAGGDVGPSPIFAHYLLRKHLGHLVEVKREVEVSHWGSARVREECHLFNEGAGLEGEYDRYAVAEKIGSIIGNRRQPGYPWPESHIVFSMPGAISRRAYDIEYYDEIGNISSSHVRREGGSHTHVELEPRFPILGQWQTDWHFEYSLPLRAILSSIDSNSFALNVSLGPSLKGVFTDKLEFRAILPAGAKNVKVLGPRGIEAQHTEGRWGMLDVWASRPVATLELRNFLVPDSEILWSTNIVQVQYDLPGGIWVLLLKPLYCGLVLLLPLLLIVVVNRLELNIYKDGEKEASDLLSHRAVVGRRLWALATDLLHAEDDYVEDVAAAGNNENALEVLATSWKTRHNACSQQMKEVCDELPHDETGPKVAAAVQKLQEAVEEAALSIVKGTTQKSEGKLRQAESDLLTLLNSLKSDC